MFCKECGSKIEVSDAVFCANCGKRLQAVSIPPSSPDMLDIQADENQIKETVVNQAVPYLSIPRKAWRSWAVILIGIGVVIVAVFFLIGPKAINFIRFMPSQTVLSPVNTPQKVKPLSPEEELQKSWDEFVLQYKKDGYVHNVDGNTRWQVCNDSFHQYEGKTFGIIDSAVDYDPEQDLFFYDTNSMKWKKAPSNKKESEGGEYYEVDTESFSREHGVPKGIFVGWLKENEDTSKRFYNDDWTDCDYPIKEALADVTGDGVADQITLIMVKSDASAVMAESMRLRVRDKASKKVSSVSLDAAYDGDIFVGPIVPELGNCIFITLDYRTNGYPTTGHWLMNCNGSTSPVNLVDPKILYDGPKWQCHLSDGYKLAIDLPEAKFHTVVDLMKLPDADPKLLSGTYDASGKLIVGTQNNIYPTPYGELIPKDIDGDGYYELMGKQLIQVENNGNFVGADSTLKWQNGRLCPILASIQTKKPY